MKHLLVIAMVTLAGCAATTMNSGNTVTQATVQGQPQKVEAKKQKLICTREVESGSHMVRRVCRTAREAEIDRQEMQRMLDRDEVLKPAATEH